MRAEIFNDIRIGLETAGFAVTYEPTDDATPVEQLYCLVYVDDAGRSYMARMTFANDIAAAMGVKPDIEDIVQFQMNTVLPFEVETPSAEGTARLLHLVNLVNGPGTFILSEDANAIIYRFVLTSSSYAIEPYLVVEAANMVLSAMMLYGGLIERVASGGQSYADALADIQAQGAEALAQAEQAQTQSAEPVLGGNPMMGSGFISG